MKRLPCSLYETVASAIHIDRFSEPLHDFALFQPFQSMSTQAILASIGLKQIVFGNVSGHLPTLLRVMSPWVAWGRVDPPKERLFNDLRTDFLDFSGWVGLSYINKGRRYRGKE